jgi:hypothetical protein
MRWAVLHSADQEFLDLLRVENDHLAVMMDQYHRTASDPVISSIRRPKPGDLWRRQGPAELARVPCPTRRNHLIRRHWRAAGSYE